MKSKLLLMTIGLATLPIYSQALETQRAGRVIASGPERAQIQSIPIELRPSRPLHFYGNTVRRRYYRGTPVAGSRNVMESTVVIPGVD